MVTKSVTVLFLVAANFSSLLACGLTECGSDDNGYIFLPVYAWDQGNCQFSVCSFVFNADHHDIVFDIYMPNGAYYNDVGILMTVNGYNPTTGNYSVYCPNSNNRCFVTMSGSEFQVYGAFYVDTILIYTTGNSVSSFYYIYSVGIAYRDAIYAYRQIWPPITNALNDTTCMDCNLQYTAPPYARTPISTSTTGNSPSVPYFTPLSSSPSSTDNGGYSATSDLDASVIRKETGLLVGVLVPVLSAVVVSAVLIPVGIWVARSKNSKSLVKAEASMTVFNPTQSTPTPENKTTTVVTSHTASSDEEISVQKGDVVTVLDANEEDYWIVEIDGKVGLVPVACLAK